MVMVVSIAKNLHTVVAKSYNCGGGGGKGVFVPSPVHGGLLVLFSPIYMLNLVALFTLEDK